MGDEGTRTPRGGGGTPQGGRGTARDAAEIRGRIAVCFSAAELRRFAEELGVTGVTWDRGLNDAAHDLVRHFEKRGELGKLVGRLREARPLVEWPELSDLPAAAPPAPFAEHAPHIPPPAPLPDVAPMPVSPPKDVSPTLRAPPMPPAMAATGAPGPSRSSGPALGGGSAARSLRGLFGSSERGPAGAPRRVEPRLLAAAGALACVCLATAFLVGRASSSPGSEPAAASDPRDAGAASDAPSKARPDGVAALAAAAVKRRVESVARVCEIPPGPAGDVMRRAFERCGPKPPLSPQRATDGAGLDRPAADVGLQAPPGRPAPRPAAGAPLPAAGNAGCVAACDRRHRACRSQCGPEPTQSSRYKRYQDCLSTCLEQSSKCRLGCL